MNGLEQFIQRLEQLVSRVEQLLPAQTVEPDWQAPAFYWRNKALQAVHQPHYVALDSLQNVERQKQAILRNTQRFAEGKPANNVLLTGARGTGKSSLIKACWHCHRNAIKLVEIDKPDLAELPELLDLLASRPERFIIFCDDLSFEEGEVHYKALKSALDGSICAPGENILFYATSNRRHLLPHKMSDNLETQNHDGEIRPGDSIEEKTSLAERFGLWLSFYSFSQDEYLAAARYWVESMGGQWNEKVREDALRWAMTRHSRSGRVAWQFARDQAN